MKESPTMSSFSFRYPKWVEIEASAWVNKWADVFLSNEERRTDDGVYMSLIEKKGQFSGEDFERIGQWKEG
jgi:hypothetical protein